MSAVRRVLQLSDTHFLEAGHQPEGGGAYDTSEAFEAVFAHADGGDGADLVVVTGDVADHGRTEQYRQAAHAFSRFGVPVNVCPGNHDRDAPYTAAIGRLGVSTSRVVELDEWCFLFVDSNAGVMIPDATGRYVDPVDVDDRLHRNGALGSRESAWVKDMCATTQAEHIFVWIHHPPWAPVGLSEDAAYDAEWAALLPQLPKVRGFGAGHTHVPDSYVRNGLPLFVAPSLKHNFDLRERTLLPPGYRTYNFAPDGTVTSDVHLVDDERWPRRPMPRSVFGLLTGELSAQEFAAIVARRRAAS